MMGIVVGVVPKFSILPWVIGIFAMLLPLNLVAFFISIVVFSFAGPLLDPWFHQVGYSVLTDPSLRDFWESLAQSEAFVWLQLDNTVVTGSVVAWLVAFLPGYFVCKALVLIIRPTWNRVFGPLVGGTNYPPIMSS